MTGVITINTIGADAGPFNIYSDVDGFISAFAIDVTRDDLLAGYSTNLIPDNTNEVKINSIGYCVNSILIQLTTTTTTAIPTITPFSLSTLQGDACLTPDLSPYDQTFYHNGIGTYPDIGDIIYYDAGGTLLVDGAGGHYQMANLNYLFIDSFGISTLIECR